MKPKAITFNSKFTPKVPKRRKTLVEMLKIEAKQFCLNTTLHGYKFIVQPKTTMTERVTWTAICLGSLITALTLLFIAWFSFQENPTVLVTDSTHYPIWNYAFPAVTLCNYNMISKRKANELAKNLTVKNGRTPQEIAWDLRLLMQLVRNNDPTIPEGNYTRLYNLLKDNDISVDSAIRRLAPTCEDMLQRCMWKGEQKRCESMFEPVWTSEGFCCAFNYFALKNHTFNGLLANKAPKRPRRVSACGHQTALEVLANSYSQDYFASHIPSLGHRIFIHNPYYFPDNILQSVLVPTNTLCLISVNPTLTYSTDNIKKMTIETRQCLFPGERNLINFEQYSFHNCFVECRMNLTIQLCGCKPFYSIYGEENDDKICTVQDIPCLREYDHLITSSVPGYDFNSIKQNKKYGSEKGMCDCLPDCEDTEYLSESSAGILSTEYTLKQSTILSGVTIRNHSLFKIFFNDLVATRNRRDVIFNWHTLLAYYGGILGLFTGFSFVSGMEIIYFFSIRLLADMARDKEASKRSKRIIIQNNPEINIQPTVYGNLGPRRLNLEQDLRVKKRLINSNLE